jgi:hypothetical protein
VIRDAIESWLEIMRLFVFVNIKGVSGAGPEGRRRVGATWRVGFDANVRRRHELRVRPQLEAASPVKGLLCFGLYLPPNVAHSPSLR